MYFPFIYQNPGYSGWQLFTFIWEPIFLLYFFFLLVMSAFMQTWPVTHLSLKELYTFFLLRFKAVLTTHFNLILSFIVAN